MSQVESAPARSLARSMKNAVNDVLNRWRYQVLLNQQVFPTPPRTILVVCKGNICRSPLAEAYLKHEVEKNGLPVAVSSAGLETSFGKPAHPLAQVVGTQKGLSLHKHATQPLHKDQVEGADLILVMEWRQRNRLVKLYPQAKGKVFLLRQFYDQTVREVADPYSGTIEDFEACFSMMKQACDVLVKQMVSVDRRPQ
ncbi:MAG: low molecular weight phosphotyrosine protein phosphatase [Nitrospira sp.]|nr:low molecular weight phosphotyrosine protein phosphatase [Nitrospira sp.]